ncbi:MAG: 16S rRNA (cytidine(1402)-2'-O)-methyltransferase [Calditrichaeota bacterium]|nr:16S rRNA (cytidine(1402)-2'-O)-methyltransferase [Calditrichota bacterium]
MIDQRNQIISTGKLYLIPTPIGNLADITLRALEVLRNSDMVLAEDTRRVRILLDKYDISQKPISNHDHNSARMAGKIVEWIRGGRTIALVSDAGSPGISDPGYRAVKAVIDAGLPLESLPGATALIPALVLSGLGVDRFVFEGFLPVKKGRETRLSELASEGRTLIFYEGPHRLVSTLGHLSESLGSNRLAAVARELTKLYEEVKRGTLVELEGYYNDNSPKGEIVIVVEGLTAFKKRERTMIRDGK